MCAVNLGASRAIKLPAQRNITLGISHITHTYDCKLSRMLLLGECVVGLQLPQQHRVHAANGVVKE